jgi:hypothetical protein
VREALRSDARIAAGQELDCSTAAEEDLKSIRENLGTILEEGDAAAHLLISVSVDADHELVRRTLDPRTGQPISHTN